MISELYSLNRQNKKEQKCMKHIFWIMKFGILQPQQLGFSIIGNLVFLDLDCRSVGDGRSTWITQLIDKYSKYKYKYIVFSYPMQK